MILQQDETEVTQCFRVSAVSHAKLHGESVLKPILSACDVFVQCPLAGFGLRHLPQGSRVLYEVTLSDIHKISAVYTLLIYIAQVIYSKDIFDL